MKQKLSLTKLIEVFPSWFTDMSGSFGMLIELLRVYDVKTILVLMCADNYVAYVHQGMFAFLVEYSSLEGLYLYLSAQKNQCNKEGKAYKLHWIYCKESKQIIYKEKNKTDSTGAKHATIQRI